ncbi:MAG TPA: methionine biosynthesis protein MetW [Candidatus Bathyarchaeia archaeon]|nr:methionine biosynthesis protein MetW [Candidatus Bathyarchaeia archaeon]
MTHSNKIENELIMEWISEGSTVLDLGCGNGELLSHLIEEKHVRAQGIELSDEAIHRCVARGLSVFQEDIDSGLAAYGDKSFDNVILNQTFQQVKKPDLVLREALRVGKKAIVGFPNFCYITDRFQIFFRGRVPVTPSLPYEWYDTPNLHFLSIADFQEYCKKRDFQIEKSVFIRGNTKVRFFPNLFAEVGLFLLLS